VGIPNRIPKMRGAALAAALVLGHCGAPTRPPTGIPSGTGWHCFGPHPEGSRATSCHRTREACVRGVADAMEDARRQGEIAAYSGCAAVPDAWCLPVGSDAAACMASSAECERLRADSDSTLGPCVRVH